MFRSHNIWWKCSFSPRQWAQIAFKAIKDKKSVQFDFTEKSLYFIEKHKRNRFTILFNYCETKKKNLRWTWITWPFKFESLQVKTSKMACAPSKDIDQPGNLPGLIRVFNVCMKKLWVLRYPMSTQWTWIRLHGCAGWSEVLLDAHVILLVLLCCS